MSPTNGRRTPISPWLSFPPIRTEGMADMDGGRDVPKPDTIPLEK
jgi:hypothetical protein